MPVIDTDAWEIELTNRKCNANLAKKRAKL